MLSTRADLFQFEETINNETTFEVFSSFQLSTIAPKSFTVSQMFTCKKKKIAGSAPKIRVGQVSGITAFFMP